MTDERRQRIAGVVLLFGLVYIFIEVITALNWVNPPYDWARNFISDLGFSDCAVFDTVPICSPLHELMNAGFMFQGTIFTIGSILVTRLMLPGRRLRLAIRFLLVASGIGTFLVGVFHQSLDLFAAGLNPLHLLAASIAIGAGNLGILALGIAVIGQREWRSYGIAVTIIGLIGMIAGTLLVFGNDLGVGLGFVERIAVYPLNTWTIGTGVGLLIKGSLEVRRAKGLSVPRPRA